MLSYGNFGIQVKGSLKSMVSKSEMGGMLKLGVAKHNWSGLPHNLWRMVVSQSINETWTNVVLLFEHFYIPWVSINPFSYADFRNEESCNNLLMLSLIIKNILGRRLKTLSSTVSSTRRSQEFILKEEMEHYLSNKSRYLQIAENE